jgi:hypothetical protein
MKIPLLTFFIPQYMGGLTYPGALNAYYPAYGYTGSRVLETNYTRNTFADIVWTQTTTVDSLGNVYLTDTTRHAVMAIRSKEGSRDFPAEGFVLAGSSFLSGYREGSATSSLLNSPKGIGYWKSPTGKEYLYIADTGNHCVRRFDIASSRIELIAGIPGSPGLRDGDGRKAFFTSPTSIGVDPTTGTVFVHDDNTVVRMLRITESESDGPPSVVVSTLISGACRSISEEIKYKTIMSRVVRCQTEWVSSSPGSTYSTTEWTWPEVCVGNSVTCRSSEL